VLSIDLDLWSLWCGPAPAPVTWFQIQNLSPDSPLVSKREGEKRRRKKRKL
jgi:hypothetical protein